MVAATGLTLRCLKCNAPLGELCWHDAGGGACQRCQARFSFVEFPARRAERRRVRPRVLADESGASCFFHDDNAAENMCAGCGRYLCSVCTLDLGGGPRCPACLEVERQQAPEAVTQRVTYDRIALLLALVPLLAWPFTLVTSPVVLGVVAFGWRKPRSLVYPSRWRFVVAAFLASLQLAGWVVLLVMALTRL